MKEKMKKYLSILTAAAVLLGGIQMPAAVKAQENVDSQAVTREAITVETTDQFMKALKDKKSPITVSELITVTNGADQDGGMLPVHIPANTVIQGTGGGELNFRCPVQLDGDGVFFKNIKMVFESTNALGSIPHREIFLAGHSLTLDNVDTYLEGGDSEFGGLSGTEKELLPTIYAGGYKNTTIGSGASLTVENSNDKTMFQAIYMGHDAGKDNKVPYKGTAVVNLDAKAVVREGVVVAQNNSAEINITGNENRYAKAKKFYGNENTTLTLNAVSINDAIVDNVGNIVLKDKACLSPKTEELQNVSLQNGACLDFNSMTDVVISGKFAGEDRADQERGILVLNADGSLRIDGMISGTTQFQTGHRLFPGDFAIDKTYIYTNVGNGVENNFTLAQKSIDNGYKLEYSNDSWIISKEPGIYKEIRRIEILSAPSKVDLRNIVHVDNEGSPNEDICFKIKWYDQNGQEFSNEEIEEYGFFDMSYVVPVRTEYWENESNTDPADWHLPILLKSSKSEQGRYYMQAFGSNELKPGDYTFLFCSEFIENNLETLADVKALKDTVKSTQCVSFYNQDTTEPGHMHNYQGEITKAATCKETGLMTYKCNACEDSRTEEIKMTDHEYKSEITKAATCKETGLMTYSCICGKQYAEEIAATGHKEVVDPEVKPTETTAGKTEGSHCSVCGEIIKRQEEIPALGKPEHTHSYQSAVTKKATCTEKGIKTYTCSCGHEYTEEIAATGHKEVVDPEVKPTETTAGKTEGSHCSVCGAVIRKQEVIPALGKPAHTHSYQSAVTKKATCTEKGIKTYTCSCGDKYTEEIAAAGHKAVIEPAVAPTETTTGKTEGSHCSVCGRVLKVPQSIPALGKPTHTHSYQSAVTKKATSTRKGVITYTCGCGHKYTKEIASPNRKFTLNKTDFTYDGKVKTPSVTVKDSKGKSLRKDTDYKIKYPKGRKNPGVYTVTVELRGNYSGKMTGSFTIKPKKTSLKKVTAKSKGMQVTWNKQKTQIDGYQIQYCTSGKFKGKTLKTATAKKNDTSKKISKLKGKKKYYVRIRTYKTVKVNGKSKKLYSDWSGKKTVNTKK